MPLISSEAFIASANAPPSTDAPAWWFVFRGSSLLVQRPEDTVQLPCAASVEELGLAPLRRQYLGTLGGRPCYSAELAEEVAAPPGMEWQGLRALYGQLEESLFALAGRAVQIVDWDRSHQFCGRCATPTQIRASERARECPQCGQVAYPRLAPAVMALVHRGRELLLARSPHFPKNMFSALAGFVEPGESLEQTLHREVMEEVGVRVRTPRYFASQPWPFPHSLMIAFECDYAGGELTPDRNEIEDAGWFDIDRLPTLPGKISIARKLIDGVVEQLRRREQQA
jgi:NAD+ diphosphatase